MNTVEIREIPPIIEDFEIGNRVYFVNHKHDTIEYGTVTAILDSRLKVKFDNGKSRPVHISHFAAGGWLGRCFPMDQLEVGSVVSVLYLGERVYGDVLEIVEGQKVRIKYHSGAVLEGTVHASEWETLESKMADFTLEG